MGEAVKAKERTVTMSNLTDRQIELLAQIMLKRSPHHRLSGQYQGRAGAAISAMLSRLEALDMIESKRRQRLTREGLKELELGLGRILPEVDDIGGAFADAINAAIAKRREQIDAEEKLEEERKAGLREVAASRRAKRNAAIPARFLELCRESRISMHLSPNIGNPESDDAIVALWNAIVDADASL